MKNIFKKLLLVLSFFLLFSIGNTVNAQEESNFTIGTYFTGIGCPHCSVASPFVKETNKTL